VTGFLSAVTSGDPSRSLPWIELADALTRARALVDDLLGSADTDRDAA
jgi:hypothetical protein